MDQETIAAIATPVGSGGIGIVRISGSDALAIAGRIFTPRKSCADAMSPETPSENRVLSLESHRLYLGTITDPDNQWILDEVLLAIMRAPRSYTREDCVEIQAHPGAVVLKAILGVVLRQGARLADPGEFTMRAFLNGRIDLTQAEAVTDIIHAKTERALAYATTQIQGHFKATIEGLHSIIKEALTEIEAGIDFPEEVGDTVDIPRLNLKLRAQVIDPLRDILNHYREGHVFRDGLQLALIGRTNVGKSSLMNRLLKKDRVIVTETPGTTRDAIDDLMSIRGIPVVVTDTAGIRNSSDAIEKIGMERTRHIMDHADLVLFVIDASEPIRRDETELIERLSVKSIILVFNKIDLVSGRPDTRLPDNLRFVPRVNTSALYNQGIDTLKDLIAETAVGGAPVDAQNALIPNLRHQLAIQQAVNELESGCAAAGDHAPMEMVAIHLREALSATGSILGITATEDVLDDIFSKFCIGK